MYLWKFLLTFEYFLNYGQQVSLFSSAPASSFLWKIPLRPRFHSTSTWSSVGGPNPTPILAFLSIRIKSKYALQKRGGLIYFAFLVNFALAGWLRFAFVRFQFVQCVEEGCV